MLKIYYICRDYLGSITHITDSSGSVVEELSYDAWGRLRNPDTHIVYKAGEELELFLGRGYTGHEHLTRFGLIHMNARLYDPAVGRFLSPDPYVQAPDFSQSFNRYSYCLNNPFKYTDPSGEFPWLIVGIVAVFTYLSNAYSNGDKTLNADGHERRNYDLGSWAWNPADWFKPSPGNPNPSVIITVGANTDGDFSGSIAVGNPYGLMPALGYNSKHGFGIGIHHGNTNLFYLGNESQQKKNSNKSDSFRFPETNDYVSQGITTSSFLLDDYNKYPSVSNSVGYAGYIVDGMSLYNSYMDWYEGKVSDFRFGYEIGKTVISQYPPAGFSIPYLEKAGKYIQYQAWNIEMYWRNFFAGGYYDFFW